MKKYFAAILVIILLLVTIHIAKDPVFDEAAKLTAASLLVPSSANPLTASLQNGTQNENNNAPSEGVETSKTISPSPAPAVNRITTVEVSRQPKTIADSNIQAPATVSKGTSKQAEMLAYINAARARVNLAPLVLNNMLAEGASLKSQDMALAGYFGHNSPNYGSMAEMMKTLGVTYQTAGENLARNSSVVGAHEDLMDSTGHRANILNPAFKQVGLGFYQAGELLFITQWFTN